MNAEALKNTIQQLYWFDGYKREAALQQLNGCFEPELFPHLLLKLSDYVPSNQQLAAQHLATWANQSQFSELCIEYFVDIVAATKRIRTVQDIETLLFAQISQNLDSVKTIVSAKQGRLSRALFAYVQQEKLMSDADFLLLSKNAVDQKIRHYWINFILKQAVNIQEENFISTKYIDVKKRILNHLFEKNQLSDYLLILAFKSESLSLIDFSIFVLKKRNFDFDIYFKKLDESKDKVKVYLLQMLLLKWNKQDFFFYFSELKRQADIVSVLNQAIHLNYLSIAEVVNLLYQKNVKLPFYLIQRLSKIGGEMRDIDELYGLSSTEIYFEQRLDVYNDLYFWDSLDWLMKIWKYCNTQSEQELLKEKVQQVLKLSKNQYYAPIWTQQLKEETWILLKAIGYSFKLFDQYGDEYDHIFKLLKIV